MPSRRRKKPTAPRTEPLFAPFWLKSGQAPPAPAFQTYVPMVGGPPPTPAPRNQIMPLSRGTTYGGMMGMGNVPPKTTPRALTTPIPGAHGAGMPAGTHAPTFGLFAEQPAAQAAEAGTPSPARYFGRWGYAAGHVLNPEQRAADQELAGVQYTPPQTPAERAAATAAAAAAGGGGGGGGGGGLAGAPAGVNPQWYAEFQRQHGGQTPEQFYAQTGEGLPEAMADLEWSQGFAQMYGRPPSEYDWRAHWFATRVGYTPEEREAARWRNMGQRRRQTLTNAEEEAQRPPQWQPPQIIWR